MAPANFLSVVIPGLDPATQRCANPAGWPRRSSGAGTPGLLIAGIVGGLAIGMSLLGWL